MTFREHLVRLRAKYAPSESQAELARRIGLTRGSLNGWERGHAMPTAANLQALLDLYGAEADDRLEAWRLAASAAPSQPTASDVVEAGAALTASLTRAMRDGSIDHADVPGLRRSVADVRTQLDELGAGLDEVERKSPQMRMVR